MSGMHALQGFIFNMPKVEMSYIYLEALSLIRREHVSNLRDRLVFNAICEEPDAYDLSSLAGFDWIARDPRFWAILCGLIGRGKNDGELVSLLFACVNLGTALARIPEDLIDAWLRMAERGAEAVPAEPPILDVLDLAVLKLLRPERPDLITRARHVLADLGEHEAVRRWRL
jgi:hypothetical protein